MEDNDIALNMPQTIAEKFGLGADTYDEYLAYFHRLLDGFDRDMLCTFLLEIMSSANEWVDVNDLISNIVSTLLQSLFPAIYQTHSEFSIQNQIRLIEIFCDTSYETKDAVLMSFSDYATPSMSYDYKIYLYTFCPTLRLKISIKIFETIDERFEENDRDFGKLERYTTDLFTLVMPVLFESKQNVDAIADADDKSFISSSSLYVEILETLKVIFDGFVVPSSMEVFARYNQTCRHVPIGWITGASDFIVGHNQMKAYNSFSKIIRNFIQKFELDTIEESDLGLLSIINYPPQGVSDFVTNSCSGSTIVYETNRMLVFISTFYHVFSYYLFYGYRCGDTIFAINYDPHIKRSMMVLTDAISRTSSEDYGSEEPLDKRLEYHIRWIDHLIDTILSVPSMEARLMSYMRRYRRGRQELLGLLIQTEFITDKSMTRNSYILNIVNRLRDLDELTMYSTYVIRCSAIWFHFENENTYNLVIAIAGLFDTLEDENYTETISPNRTYSGGAMLSDNTFSWIDVGSNMVRHVVSAFVAYILNAQISWGGTSNPYLMCVTIMLCQHYTDYYFICVFIMHRYISREPSVYLNLFSDVFASYISNVNLIHDLLTLFDANKPISDPSSEDTEDKEYIDWLNEVKAEFFANLSDIGTSVTLIKNYFDSEISGLLFVFRWVEDQRD